ncbi:MAG: MarR family transcriptional regulator [Parvularculaceae bacterium]
MTQNSDFNLADFMPYQLSILSTRVSALIAQDYQARFGISIPEWRVIVVLASAGELSATGIAEATRMDKVRVTRTVQGLIGNQLATRRASLEDGRSTLLTLSAKGQEIYQEIIPLARKAEQDILSPLAEAEKTALQAIIDKMSDQLDQLDAEGDCSTASRA